MKLVALLPFKNEAWILPAYLSSVAPVVDEIVAVDDGSTDDSRRLVEEAGGYVEMAREGGDWETHWGSIREDLLRIGRQRGGTHFICLDADEALTAPARKHLRGALAALEPGMKLAMQWLALWRSSCEYRDDDSVWSDNWKDFAFADRHGYSFVGQWPHAIGRTPGPNDGSAWMRLPPERGAVLHFQFVPWERFQAKQAWYRCAELIRAPRKAFDINAMYAHGLEAPDTRTARVPGEWLEGLTIPDGLDRLGPTWHWDEMLTWFDERGIEFFEPVQIWQVPRLHELFTERVGREPKPTLRLSPARTAVRLFRQRVLNSG